MNLTTHIHPSAIVEDGASTGSGTTIWHGCHVRGGSEIGRDCTIGFSVYVDRGVVIGDRCKVENHVSLFDGVVLDDEVFIGPHAVFSNDRHPRAVSPDWELTRTRVRRGASIGANATVVCGADIGAWAMIGAGAVVSGCVPAHALMVGVPARLRGWVCQCGRVLARHDDPLPDSCEHCGRSLGAALAA
jgi:acetyltransferase-like isoleucine patch superfamily enzyme